MNGLELLKALFALLFVLGLIAAAAYGARRLGMLQAPAAPGARRMRVSETLYLDPRRRLVIVRVDGEEHVLLLSLGQDLVLARRPAAPAAADAP